jgi:transposase
MCQPGIYPTDVSDEEGAFVAPYLCLMKEDAPQRVHCLRAVFNALRYLVRAGCPWRLLPNDLPPWQSVHQQATRWLKAGVFEAMVHDLRMILRLLAERPEQPTAAVLDARTMQGSIESGLRSGYDGYKKKKGSKVHLAVDTLGHLLAAHVSPANENERAYVEALLTDVQEVTGESVEVAFVDSGYNGAEVAAVAQAQGVRLEVVSLSEAKKGFVLLPRRWVVERSFAWTARCRRLARDYERLSSTLVGLHFVAFAMLMLTRLLGSSPWKGI